MTASQKKNKNTVSIIYFGKYTYNIGPPRSMYLLKELLAERRFVNYSNNLRYVDVNNSKIEKMRRVSKLRKYVRGSLKTRLHELNLLRLIFIENFRLLLNTNFNDKNIIIVTQPFLFRIFQNHKIIYIRRGNEPLEKRNHRGILGILERRFKSFNSIYLVYLVKQSQSNKTPYTVIPNHFDDDDFTMKINRSTKSSVHFIGTWCYRKGSDYIIDNSDLLLTELGEPVNVYGSLGEDNELNNSLMKSQHCYHGIVPNAHEKLCVGDVYLSFSRLEGLQRSLVEAMLQGCIILAFLRPDTQQFLNVPGCFITSPEKLENEIRKIGKLTKQEKIQLGLSNREWAANEFSKAVVLEKWENLLRCVETT